MKQKFREIRLSKANRERLETINKIIVEYQRQGYRLTLRQLYYQLVSRDVIPNDQKEYTRLSKLLKEGRLGGFVDWDAIEDRLRTLEKPASWDSPADILGAAARQYRRDRMEGQATVLEVWVEKDALSNVLERVTKQYGIGLQVNRGYGSVSAIYEAYQRFREALNAGKPFRLLYLGDHDPSGIDMIRDITHRIFEMWYGEEIDPEERLPADPEEVYEFAEFEQHFQVQHVALTMAQIRQYNPPPNPAKIQDPRAGNYIQQYGNTSWEVDALRPEVLNGILRDAIEQHLDMDTYQAALAREAEEKERMANMIKGLE